MTFEEFATKHNATIESTPIDRETVNDIRRAFQRAMTAEQFAEFEECEG